MLILYKGKTVDRLIIEYKSFVHTAAVNKISAVRLLQSQWNLTLQLYATT